MQGPQESSISVVGGNWKMNPEAESEARILASGVASLGNKTDRQVVVYPPNIYLRDIRGILDGSGVSLGAQNLAVRTKKSGAHTGEVSANMLKDIGCTDVLVGHSERRQGGETDEDVKAKTRAALDAGLLPTLCVGETLAEREAGRANEVVERQVRAALEGLEAETLTRLFRAIAYEPVWAIGTGKTASPQDAQAMHGHIRGVLASLANDDAARKMRITYGGSVTPDTVDGLMAQPDVDGALVGGAALDPKKFGRIVNYQEAA